MAKCPFCDSYNAGPLNLPNNQHVLLQTISDNGSINIGQGLRVDLIACPSCKNLWFHSDGITSNNPNA